jgi:hypothetical protein
MLPCQTDGMESQVADLKPPRTFVHTQQSNIHAIEQSPAHDAATTELKRRIAAFERDPDKFQLAPMIDAPPGSPIGDDEAL